MKKYEEVHKDLYQDIVKYLGESLSEYNMGAWSLFRDQMATELSSEFIYGRGTKPDASLLLHNKPFIDRTNLSVKGIDGTSKFTYYTNEGPKHAIEERPVLVNPEKDIFEPDDLKVNLGGELPYSHIGSKGHYNMYDEEGEISSNITDGTLDGDEYKGFDESENDRFTLVGKTKEWFKSNTEGYISKRFTSLISRFHTDSNQISTEELKDSPLISGYSEHGLSRGRNLLKQNPSTENGYDNPYCRVWTWHHQYHRLAEDTIRPLTDEYGEPLGQDVLNESYNWDIFRSIGDESKSGFKDGGTRLAKYGKMYNNGGKPTTLVNITPTLSNGKYGDDNGTDVEKCMFSIENLAWKGMFQDYGDETEIFGLSREQKGPLGGRIMWFPPYDIKFNETTNANWNENTFIGRGEPMYTYSNTTRTGTLSFKMLIDHPAILDYWEKRNLGEEKNPDDVDSKEQELLRFFAGCSVLTAGERKVENPASSELPYTETQLNGMKKIKFFVFFPNNYSGKDDRGKDSVVNPIDYLMNGVGAQKYKTNGGVFDLPVMTDAIYTPDESKHVGGYEVRNNVGVSIIKTATTTNDITEVQEWSSSGRRLYTLVKMTGARADKATSGDTKNWHKYRYYYRADKDTLNQDLVGVPQSYIDSVSYQLNSIGYSKALNVLNTGGSQSDYYSFADVYVALAGEIKSFKLGLYNKENVGTLKKILEGNYRKIIRCRGFASSQGNNPSKKANYARNKELAKERAETLKWWLKKFNLQNTKFYDSTTFEVDAEKYEDMNDSNDFNAKLHRCALVEIYYDESQTTDASQTEATPDTNSVSNENKSPNVTPNEAKTAQPTVTKPANAIRYDNEARFFNELQRNAPIIANLISEKVKYFNPAFHSMSPEGFNARLTFLEQCMRQGPTISAEDTMGLNANNLAFGRPPVCVLRIGDFYNTKIIITSMTKDFEPLVWDLNQEGIGVIPMIANINLSFTFIGGSDLGGPIQRLQNALSFNYYANAGVYDNRAEAIEYGKLGEVKLFKAFEGDVNF